MSAKILLCEDDEFLRSGLEEMLQKEGYAVCTADSCAAAETRLASGGFDLIILDVMLPVCLMKRLLLLPLFFLWRFPRSFPPAAICICAFIIV